MTERYASLKSEYEALKTRYVSLSEEYKKTASKLKELEDYVSSLKTELNELENIVTLNYKRVVAEDTWQVPAGKIVYVTYTPPYAGYLFIEWEANGKVQVHVCYK